MSFVHYFNIFAYFVEKNQINSNRKLSNCSKAIQSQMHAIYLSFKCQIKAKDIFIDFDHLRPGDCDDCFLIGV